MMVQILMDQKEVSVSQHALEDDAGYYGCLIVNDHDLTIYLDREGLQALASAATELADSLPGHRYAKVPADD
jgi:hypothetical protein